MKGSVWTRPPSGRESATYSNPTFTGTVTITGTSNGFANGSATSPSLPFASDADGSGTGFYRIGTNSPAVACDGTGYWRWLAGGAYTPVTDVGVDIGTSALRVKNTFSATLCRGVPVTETGATHTVGTSTSHLICNRAGDVTVTLPAAATFPGRELFVRTIQAQTVTSNAANVVPRAGGAAGTAILAAADGAWCLLVSDGTNWETMAGS